MLHQISWLKILRTAPFKKYVFLFFTFVQVFYELVRQINVMFPEKEEEEDEEKTSCCIVL